MSATVRKSAHEAAREREALAKAEEAACLLYTSRRG